ADARRRHGRRGGAESETRGDACAVRRGGARGDRLDDGRRGRGAARTPGARTHRRQNPARPGAAWPPPPVAVPAHGKIRHRVSPARDRYTLSGMRGDPSRWNYETRLLAGSLLSATPALVALGIALYFATDDGWRAFWIWFFVALLTLALVFAA